MPRIYESSVIIYQLDPSTSRDDADEYDNQEGFNDMYIQVSSTRLRKELAKTYKSTKRAKTGEACFEMFPGGASIYTYSHEDFIAAMSVIEAIPGFQWDYRTEEDWSEEHAGCCSH